MNLMDDNHSKSSSESTPYSIS